MSKLIAVVLFLAIVPIALAQHQVTIAWQEAAPAAGFDPPSSFVVQKAGPSVPQPPATAFTSLTGTVSCATVTYSSGITAYSCVDLAVAGGNTYWYQVAATNTAGTSTFAGPVSAAVPLAPPSPPTGVTATPK